MVCHFLLQGIFPTQGSNQSPALQADSLLNELPGKTFPQHRIFQPQIIVPRCRNITLWLSSVAQSCLTLCNFIDGSMSCIPVHHQLPELTQIHVHGVSDAIQPSQPVIPFSSWLQSFPESRSFQISQFFTSGGQSIGASASASVLPMNIQD